MARVSGKAPKPTALKLIEGTARPDRINLKEAIIPDIGVPDPPDHLSVEGKKEWDRVARDLHAAGLLTKVDRAILAAYCQAYGRWVMAERHLTEMGEKLPLSGFVVRTSTGTSIQNPLVGTANKAMRDMATYATDLGMTPSSRSRVAANPPDRDEDEDSAEKYFK